MFLSDEHVDVYIQATERCILQIGIHAISAENHSSAPVHLQIAVHAA